VVEVSPHLAGECGRDAAGLCRTGRLPSATAREVEATVTRWLSLDDDPARFPAHRAGAIPSPWAPILAATAGLHQVRFASLAEGIVYFALAQRSSQWLAAGPQATDGRASGAPGLCVDGVTQVAFPRT